MHGKKSLILKRRQWWRRLVLTYTLGLPVMWMIIVTHAALFSLRAIGDVMAGLAISTLCLTVGNFLAFVAGFIIIPVCYPVAPRDARRLRRQGKRSSLGSSLDSEESGSRQPIFGEIDHAETYHYFYEH